MARSFEYALWKLTAQSTYITIIAVYHPPYLEKKSYYGCHVH